MFILFAERKVGEQHGPAAQGVLAAVQTLREMNADNLRKVPADAPTAFIKPRWKPLVITPEGLDRKFYEICALSELKNALRSGDIWVKGSRQFRDFDDYLLPAEKFAALKREQAPRRSTRTATSTGRAFAAAGRAVGHRHPRPRTTSCPMPSSPSQG
ncbi:hypothetical protein ECZU24_58300 [Escherichia coli]|nr:hypothetical protein ECZU24_58300 [Escherichia coli]